MRYLYICARLSFDDPQAVYRYIAYRIRSFRTEEAAKKHAKKYWPNSVYMISASDKGSTIDLKSEASWLAIDQAIRPIDEYDIKVWTNDQGWKHYPTSKVQNWEYYSKKVLGQIREQIDIVGNVFTRFTHPDGSRHYWHKGKEVDEETALQMERELIKKQVLLRQFNESAILPEGQPSKLAKYFEGRKHHFLHATDTVGVVAVLGALLFDLEDGLKSKNLSPQDRVFLDRVANVIADVLNE